MSKKLVIIIGTRPEGIKLAPIINAARSKFNQHFKPIVITTGQHTDLLDDVFALFNISPDYTLTITRETHLLSELQSQLTTSLEQLFKQIQPDVVMVQGDTLSTLSGAMAAFYQKIPIAYVESGLRSGDLYAPFPEEANRLMVTKLAQWHFTPTQRATQALQNEGITQHVHQVGNTVVDAMQYVTSTDFSDTNRQHPWIEYKRNDRHMLLVTIHRRENWDANLDSIMHAVKTLSDTYANQLDIVWITHANPSLAQKINATLNNISNIFIYPPANYAQLLHLISLAYIVLTDSGGIQEEAPSFNAPVLVARDVSERMEGVDAGCATLIGTKITSIINAISHLIEHPNEHKKMTGIQNPYGDGTASQQILKVLTH